MGTKCGPKLLTHAWKVDSLDVFATIAWLILSRAANRPLPTRHVSPNDDVGCSFHITPGFGCMRVRVGICQRTHTPHIGSAGFSDREIQYYPIQYFTLFIMPSKAI